MIRSYLIPKYNLQTPYGLLSTRDDALSLVWCFFFAITIWDQQNYIESFETLNKRKSVPGAEKEIFQTMLLNHHNLVNPPPEI